MNLKAMMVVMLFAVNGFSAPMKSAPVDEVREALKLPLQSRLKTLLMKEDVFTRLEQMASSENEDMETRWRAVTALGRLEPQKARIYLEKYMTDSSWFMRNAAIIVAPYGERAWAMKWIDKLLDDKALVVRTAAVDALKKVNGIELQNRLWEKLYAQENFKNGKSLWIRKHIVELLVRFANYGQETKFVKILKDDDAQLHSHALVALKKISSEDLTRDQWMARY